jgi:hypothetical protein
MNKDKFDQLGNIFKSNPLSKKVSEISEKVKINANMNLE